MHRTRKYLCSFGDFVAALCFDCHWNGFDSLLASIQCACYFMHTNNILVEEPAIKKIL